MIHFAPITDAKFSVCETKLNGKLYSVNEHLVECEKCLKILGKNPNKSDSE